MEKLKYYRHVGVHFQENAWYDKWTIIHWVRHHWKSQVEGTTLLLLDQHKAQKTSSLENLSSEYNTTTVLIPPGCTSLVWPLDVVFNTPF